MLDWWKKRKDKSVEKAGDTLKNIVTTKEQRLEAIEELRPLAADIAVPQLLKRFDLVVESGLQDQKEKEMVEEIILSHKDKSVSYIVAAFPDCKRISWYIKLAEKLLPQEEYIQLLIQNTRKEFVGFDDNVQERNIEILLALKEISDPRAMHLARQFLDSRDEHVKIAALECLENHAARDEDAKKIFLNFLQNPVTDDSSRIVGMARTIAERHHWI